MKLKRSLSKFFVLLLAYSFVLLAPAPVSADESSPKAYVKDTFLSVKQMVSEDKDSLSPQELNKKIERRLEPVFDFQEMSRRSLGTNWKTAGKEQRDEFIKLFSSLLSRTYIAKIREGIEKSDVNIREERVRGDKAIVRTVVKNEGDKVAIDYRLMQKQNKWLVYDIIVENVGLIGNYRNEFGTIVRKESLEGLLKRLREKEAKEST